MTQEELEICIQKIKENRKSSDFKEIYDFFSGKIYYTILRYLKDTNDAQDVLQETFIAVFEKIKKYTGAGSFYGWIKTIAVNNSLKKIRENSKLFFLEENDEWITSDDENFELESNENLNSKKIETVLSKMPVGYKIILNLFVLEGYSHREIGELLSISESTSRSQLNRAKKKFKEIIEKEQLNINLTYIN